MEKNKAIVICSVSIFPLGYKLHDDSSYVCLSAAHSRHLKGCWVEEWMDLWVMEGWCMDGWADGWMDSKEAMYTLH